MLIGQAQALQAIFMNLSRESIRQPYLKNCATFLRLALKTQSQCHARSETLAAIKNPPVVYAKQATVTSRPRQINNGMTAPSHAGKEICEPNRLLEAQHGDYLDVGTADATVEADSQLANVGEIDTPKSRRVRRGLRATRTRADSGGVASASAGVAGAEACLRRLLMAGRRAAATKSAHISLGQLCPCEQMESARYLPLSMSMSYVFGHRRDPLILQKIVYKGDSTCRFDLSQWS